MRSFSVLYKYIFNIRHTKNNCNCKQYCKKHK